MMYKVKLDYSEALECYLKMLKKKEIRTKKMYNLLTKYTKRQTDYSFKVLINNYKKFCKIAGKFNVDNYLYLKYATQTYRNKRQNKTNLKIYQEIEKAKIDFAPAVKENYSIVYNCLKDPSKEDEIIERTNKLLKQYPFALKCIFNEVCKKSHKSEKIRLYCEKLIEQFKDSQTMRVAGLANSMGQVFCMYGRNFKGAVKYFKIANDLSKSLPKYKKDYDDCRRITGELRPLNYGEKVFDFSLPNLKGEQTSLTKYRGKVVLLDFWASWCGPCVAEIPNLKEIYKKYKDKGLEIISITFDKKDEDWKNAIKKHGLNWIQLTANGTEVYKKFNLYGIPRIMLLDKDGKIFGDKLRGKSIERDIKKILNI